MAWEFWSGFATSPRVYLFKIYNWELSENFWVVCSTSENQAESFSLDFQSPALTASEFGKWINREIGSVGFLSPFFSLLFFIRILAFISSIYLTPNYLLIYLYIHLSIYQPSYCLSIYVSSIYVCIIDLFVNVALWDYQKLPLFLWIIELFLCLTLYLSPHIFTAYAKSTNVQRIKLTAEFLLLSGSSLFSGVVPLKASYLNDLLFLFRNLSNPLCLLFNKF